MPDAGPFRSLSIRSIGAPVSPIPLQSSVEEMELLRSFDQICEDATNAAREMQLLKSKYNEELSKCEALRVNCTSLSSENERLTKLYTGFVSSLSDQIEYRSKYEALQDKLKRSSDEYLQKEKEGKVEIQLIEQGYRERIEKLETQIWCLTIQNTENQKLIDQLRSDLATQNSHVNAVVNEMGTLHHSLELKYHQEVQDLKDCLMLEQEEKNELIKKLQDLEKESMLNRIKIAEQQRDLNSNRNVEGLKEKIMKLRKENDILKRKCKVVEDG